MSLDDSVLDVNCAWGPLSVRKGSNSSRPDAPTLSRSYKSNRSKNFIQVLSSLLVFIRPSLLPSVLSSSQRGLTVQGPLEGPEGRSVVTFDSGRPLPWSWTREVGPPTGSPGVSRSRNYSTGDFHYIHSFSNDIYRKSATANFSAWVCARGIRSRS